MEGDEKILAVSAEALFGQNEPFNGFRYKNESGISLDRAIMPRRFRFMQRSLLERQGASGSKLEHKQVVPYVIVINPQNMQVYAYRHCANPQDRDTEVRGLWFFGMGANVGVTDYYDPSGSEKRYAGEELIMRARDRLIDEAIKMDGKVLESRILGFINEERAEELGLEDELLEREILGVVYLTLTDSHSVTPRDELFDGGLAGIDRLMAITGAADYDDAEITFNRVYLDPWTRIMKNPLIRVLESLERENEIKAEENNNSRNTRKQKGGRGRRDKR